MWKRTRHFDLAIVGCGIEGSLIAFLAGLSGRFDSICAIDAPHRFNLGPDTLRSQAILHSGIQYGERNQVAALQMRYSGVAMHESLGIPIPETPGVLRFEQNYDLMAVARQLRMDHLVDRLNEDEAKRRLGLFYKSGFAHFQVPDTPFDEALVLEKARLMARELGVEFISAKVIVRPHPGSTQRCLIETENELIDAQHIVLSAGAGIPKLLDQLKIEHRLVVERTPLLRFKSNKIMETPYFADKSANPRTSGLFVTQQSFPTSPPSHCLVVAVTQRERLYGEEIDRREVTKKEEDAIRAALTHTILPDRNALGYRLVAGHKVECLNADGIASIDPFVSTFPDYEGLVAAVPGKATLSFDVAERVMELLHPGRHEIMDEKFDQIPDNSSTASEPKKMSAKASGGTDVPPPLGHRPVMHHDPIFDGILDDRNPLPPNKE